jgi:hypothetical protein
MFQISSFLITSHFSLFIFSSAFITNLHPPFSCVFITF